MKSWLILLMLSVSLVARGAETSTNLLSIHLLANQSAWRGITNLSELKLAAEPVITDADILEYKDSLGGFAISAEAGNRLARALWQTRDEPPWFRENGDYEFIPFDTPFVAVSFGERLRLGFFTWMSATTYFDKPIIQPGFGSCFINRNATTNVWLTICRTYGNCSAFPRSENANDVRKAAVEVFRSTKPESGLNFLPSDPKIDFDNLDRSNHFIRIR